MRSVEEIYQEMLSALEARCGFRPEESCDLAVRLYAAAAQIQALDIQTEWVLAQSFPQTAQGKYLDHHAMMRGLQRMPAAKAVGTLRFSVREAAGVDFLIPANTVCMTETEQRFQTTKDAVLIAGELFVDVPAEAVLGGKEGNAAKQTVIILTACPVGITGCTNPDMFVGGRDGEDDESLRARILDSYQRLPNGANAAWYEKTAMDHEGVAEAKAIRRARGIGTVDVYIATEAGVPDEELLATVQEDLQKKREIAVDVQVLAPDAVEVAVSAQVETAAGVEFESVRDTIEQAVAAFFSGHMLGKSVRVAELTSLIFRQEGVENVRLLMPAEDIAAAQGALPVLTGVTVTEWEA